MENKDDNNGDNMSEIKLIPDFPDKIIEHLESGKKLVFFLGSGFGKMFGLPLWSELSGSMINKINDLGYINELEKKILLDMNNPKKQISPYT